MFNQNSTRPELSLSRYVYIHDVSPDIVGLYTPFHHEVSFLQRPIWDRIKLHDYASVPQAVMNDLLNRNFVVTPDFDSLFCKNMIVPPIQGIFSLFLLVTSRCNMGCKYCVVNMPEKQTATDVQESPMMSREVADAALSVFFRELGKCNAPVAKITFYGGEPLLNKDLLCYLVPKIRSLRYTGQKAPIEILCFTNGLQYDESVASMFKEHDVTVGFSIDGTQEQHDTARKGSGGESTFEQIIRNYHRYCEKEIRTGISCTIGAHNVAYLPQIARYFADELKARSVQFQTPIQMKDNSNPLYVSMKDAARSALEGFKYLRSKNIEEGLALRRIAPFTQGIFHYRDCLAVGGELSVATDGTIGPCHNAIGSNKDLFRGNILDENCNPFVNSVFTEWYSRMPLNMTACQQCPFIALCGGGCPYNAFLTKGSIWEIDPQQCDFMKEFMNWLLEDIWERYWGVMQKHTTTVPADFPITR